MKTLLATVLLLVSFPGVKYGAEPIPDFAKEGCPQCFKEYVKYSYEVLLPGNMHKALKEYAPTFRIFKMAEFVEELRLRLESGASNLSSYSAIFNDFNGDGWFDAAVYGEKDSAEHKGNPFVILAILSQGATSYQVMEVETFPPNKPIAGSLSLSRPGRKTEVGSDGNDAIEMKNYGIMVSQGYGTSVYYWDEVEKKFKSITTGGM